MKSLLNIGNSVSLFFILLLISCIIIIFSFDKSATLTYNTIGEIPLIEINDFTAYEITKDALNTKITAKNAKRFDNYEEMSNIELEKKSNQILDKLTAPTALKKENIIYFDNGVKNLRDDFEMFSTKAIYHIDSKIINGNGNFHITSPSQNIIGQNIYYDMQSGNIKAINIQAKLKPKETK
ncbi:MAG: hypothetical protein K2P17_06285 [Helicobacteraceae bacterium]|nr:hypothetical protein [Helicobacteraceae bacterium]